MLSAVGALLASSLAVGINIFGGTNANETDFAPWAAMGGLFKGMVIGTMVALESKLVLAEAAKRKLEIAQIQELTGRNELIASDKEHLPETMDLLTSTMVSTVNKAEEAIRSAERALRLCKQVAALDDQLGNAPKDGETILLAPKKYKLYAGGTLTLASQGDAVKGGSILVSATGDKVGEHGGHVQFTAGEQVSFTSGKSALRFHHWGSIAIVAGADGLVQGGDGKPGGYYWHLDAKKITLGHGLPLAEDALISLDGNKILVQCGVGGIAELEISDERVRLKYGNNSITLAAAGIKIEGTQIEVQADVVLDEKSMMMEESYSGTEKVGSTLFTTQ